MVDGDEQAEAFRKVARENCVKRYVDEAIDKLADKILTDIVKDYMHAPADSMFYNFAIGGTTRPNLLVWDKVLPGEHLPPSLLGYPHEVVYPLTMGPHEVLYPAERMVTMDDVRITKRVPDFAGAHNAVCPRYAEETRLRMEAAMDRMFFDALGGGKRQRTRPGPRKAAPALAQGLGLVPGHPEGPCGLREVGSRRSKRRARGRAKGKTSF